MILSVFFTVFWCQVKGRALVSVCQLGEWTYRHVACSSPFGEILSFSEHSKIGYPILECSLRLIRTWNRASNAFVSPVRLSWLTNTGLCPHLAWLCEPRRAVLSQKKPASRETGRAGGRIWATSRLSWRSGDAKSEVQARFSTLS